MISDAFRKGLNTLKLGRAFVRLVQDPTRLDEVFDMSDALDGNPELVDPIRAAFAATEAGAAGLATQPRVHVDMGYLATLPEGTLGHAFAAFVRREGIDPDKLFRGQTVGDPDKWMFEHLFETHDIWHVLTDFGTDVAGELGLQAFYLAQFPARLATLLIATGMLNTFLFQFGDRDHRMTEIAKGWAMGRQAEPIFGIDWTPLWTEDLHALRTRFGIAPATSANVALAA